MHRYNPMYEIARLYKCINKVNKSRASLRTCIILKIGVVANCRKNECNIKQVIALDKMYY